MSTERIEDVATAPPRSSTTASPRGSATVLARPDAGPTVPLLTAKLAVVAQPGAVLLPRPRLFELLDAGTAGPLTLVSAAAGWGKTVLLSSWYRARGETEHPTATPAEPPRLGWLSLEPGDGGERLWSYLAAALGSATTGQEPDAGYQPASGYGLEQLADELTRRAEPVIVVLDDLHQVDDPEVSSGLEFLLRHTAGRLRLVIGCRKDPGLALHRWRLSGELTEIRAADLAFRPEEVADLFAAYAVPLPTEQTRGLYGRTEGWPAGLRFAALALPGHPDPARFVDEFTGEHPAVAGYLTEEVLAGLSTQTRDAFCRASLVAGFSADLLNALTDRTDGDRLLTELDRHGGFVIPLGSRPAAYRCHPMLGELLRAEVNRRPAEQVARLHRRAATWFAANDLPAEALRHALAADDRAYAIAVLLRHWPDLLPYGQCGPVRPAPSPPPAERVRADPELGLACAAERLDGRDPIAATGHLDRASEYAELLDDVRRDRFRRIAVALRLAVAHLAADEPAIRAGVAALAPDQPAVRVGVAALAPDEPEIRGAAALASGERVVRVGVAELLQPAGADRTDPEAWGRTVARIVPAALRFGTGQLGIAEVDIVDGMAEATRTGLSRTARLCLGRLALARAIRGELTAAEQAARATLGAVPFGGLVRPADGVHAHLAQALVAVHRDRRDDAGSNVLRSVRAAEDTDEPLVVGLIGMLQARLLRDRGDLTGAHQALTESRRRLGDRAENSPLAHWLLIAEAELRIAHGDVELARELLIPAVEGGGVPVAVALARTYLLAGDPRGTVRTLPDWDCPDAAGWPLPVRLEAGLLGAEATRLTGDHRRAARSLERVLQLAEPEGFRQVFTRADPPVRELLAAHLDAGTAFWPLVSELLGAIDGAGRPSPTVTPLLGEPLTERELTVLRYLQSILSNVEIAAEMSLSVNTIKTHVRNIYRKLDATRRRDAVRRARERKLL
ncbi:LuxR C-terminal-related transcriptional regulator [Plantactinospora soyae]|uniref:LuxR family maltose regulon positive regulatory protein n=1 Tax=Plantactinospora soyae TaxID=1544732 RepID=A0A927ME04_9ACTN|nr:LuxR C-terminal-related transcriptional regulator [Plantactinospora soyae]MBE1492684.1 LuxR family maltose regulon positive regulatory protein [Plantactinospora soyae]